MTTRPLRDPLVLAAAVTVMVWLPIPLLTDGTSHGHSNQRGSARPVRRKAGRRQRCSATAGLLNVERLASSKAVADVHRTGSGCDAGVGGKGQRHLPVPRKVQELEGGSDGDPRRVGFRRPRAAGGAGQIEHERTTAVGLHWRHRYRRE
jgi:hypothetical protein